MTTKPVQWSSDIQPVRALYSAAALKQKLVAPCMSGWASSGIYQCVQSSMKVIWHDFFIYVEEAERQEQRSRFGRS